MGSQQNGLPVNGDEWTRIDGHVKILDENVVRRAKARGMDAIVYAPHFTRLPVIRRRAEAYSDEDLLVVPGREVFTGTWQNRKHVLAVGLDRPVPDFITLAGAMAAFDRQDAAVIAPHPEFLNVSLSQEDVAEYRDVVDAVEVYNPKLWPHHVRRAKAIARELELPRFGASYAHLHPTVGGAWTGVRQEIDDEADLVDALRETDEPGEWRARQVAHYDGPGHLLEKVGEFAHLGWENTYEKLDRVFLQGIETTHPAHVAYEGRFDDVAVY